MTFGRSYGKKGTRNVGTTWEVEVPSIINHFPGRGTTGWGKQNDGFTQQSADVASEIEERNGCYCIKVNLEHVVYIIRIYEVRASGYWETAAHELAHVRSFARRLANLAHQYNQQRQPCCDTEPDAKSHADSIVREIEQSISNARTKESDHDNSEQTGTPAAGTPIPWNGDMPRLFPETH